MSEPVAKERSDIDFEEFERRFRQRDHRGEDPLAELARLVGEHHDPYGDVFADEATLHRAAEHQASADYHAYEQSRRQEPVFGAETGLSPRLSGDFAAIEAGLRGALPQHPQPLPSHEDALYDQHEVHPDQAYPQDEGYLQDHEAQQWAEQPQAAEPAAKSRRPIYAMVAMIAVGVIGVGAAFAYKGTSSSPSEIKTIAAASGPTKIQPPKEASSADQTSQDSAMADKGQQSAPGQLVSREEQPVDISQAVQENASRNADAGGAPGDAANVPVPPSPTQAKEASPGSVSPSDQIASFGLSGLPAPKKVKVVSVRPDGSILPNDAPPVASLPITHSAPARAADKSPVAKASTPKSGGSSAKTTSRVASKPAKVASADNGGDDTPAPKPVHKAKPKPQRVATAEPTSDSEPTASVPKSGGDFAVQLAAPGSEAAAKSASSRLAKKFAEALGGRKLGFHKAESNGRSVYRVRVGSMTKDEAVSLCEKLKADGGSCFVAKN